MKKLFKTLAAFGFVTGGIALANNVIFEQANRNQPLEYNRKTYKWRHGKISYVEYGTGEPLLLLHAIAPGADLNEWEENINALSRHYHVYAFDFLGFGRSDKPPIPYSAYLYTSLICDFAENIIKAPTFVIANSLAADYAIMATSFNSNIFKKMILISPRGCGLKTPMTRKRDILISQLIASPIFGTFFYNILTSKSSLRSLLKSAGYYNNAKVSCRIVNRYYYSAHYNGVWAQLPIAALLSKQLNVDSKKALEQIKIPVHLCWGSSDDSNRVAAFNIIENLAPSAELTVFDAKALPHAECPKKFYKVCRAFLEK